MNGETAIPPGPRAHFELLKDGKDRLILKLSGQVDVDDAPLLWQELKANQAVASATRLEIDATGLTDCDSGGWLLLHYLSTNQMTPNAQVTLSGLRPELQKILQSFSMADY